MSKFTNPLDNIRVASPCAQNWDEMAGDERARFCGECKLHVYNLSGMSRREAENLIFESEGNRLCVKFFRRADGTILTMDCPVGWRALKRNVSKTATAFASLVFTALGAVGLTNFFANSNQSEIGGAAIENPKTGEFSIENSNSAREEKPFAAMGNVAVERNNQYEEGIVGQIVLTEESPRANQKKRKTVRR